MNKLNDENIKDIIRSTVEKPDIKLTSRQIIAKYEQQKHSIPTKKSLWSFPSFKMGVGFAAAALIIGSLVYFAQGQLLPPITSDSIDSGSTDTSLIDREMQQIPGGKEGEFVFMSYSALAYTPSTELNMTFYKGQSQNHGSDNNDSFDQTTLEGVLDQTMPLIEDFYELDEGFNYIRNDGVFVGQFGTYTSEYVIDETTKIIANVDFEEEGDETETELEGELVIGLNHYAYEGKTETDLSDGQTDIELTIHYNENSYLEIESENSDRKQEFYYHLVENGAQVFELKIETYRHGQHHRQMVEVEVEKDGEEYQFVVEKMMMKYYVTYGRTVIMVTSDGTGKFDYSY